MSLAWVLALLLPALVAWIVIAWLRGSRAAKVLADVPNERSLHATATPRVGGLGLLAGALPVAAWLGDAPALVMVACAA